MNRHQQEAKKYLSQVFGLNQRIESKLGQIEDLHDLATKATVTYSDMPRNPNKGHSRLEDAVIQMIELETEINQDMIKLVELKKDIIRRIKAVESSELQTVLELRYLSYIDGKRSLSSLATVSTMFSGFTGTPWMKSRFRKEYSKIKFDTVRLCDIVKVAKAKDEGAAHPVDVRLAPTGVKRRRRCGNNCSGFFSGRKKVDRCRGNRRSLVLIRVVPTLRKGDTVRSTRAR